MIDVPEEANDEQFKSRSEEIPSTYIAVLSQFVPIFLPQAMTTDLEGTLGSIHRLVADMILRV